MIYLTDAQDGGFRLTPFNDRIAKQMTIAEHIIHEDGDVLGTLAKR